ncbi:helix-turn-helix transcriptional regulator [Streptococcus marmotae]|uniref:helix-turn-helix transcriptional regulator n=1 Tax=Streptococcus marmotae TaxID=1825069 RepID=UPI0008340B29|nr:helix-turn-helix domain-containing protein [Streptococcus marmotae]
MEVILSEQYSNQLQQQIYNLIMCEINNIRQNNNLESPFLNKKQVCDYLSISNNTLDSWIERGLPVIRIGKILRFDRKEINRWIKTFEN